MRKSPWIIINTACFVALGAQMFIIGKSQLYPLHTINYMEEKSFDSVNFPVIFKICIKPAFNDEELYKTGYSSSWGYFEGRSRYNRSLIGWAGHRADGSIFSSVQGSKKNGGPRYMENKDTHWIAFDKKL